MTLFEAIEAGDAEGLSAALRAGAEVDAAGEGGRTPLIEAALRGQLALVERLLEAGAEPSFKDAEQETALLKAAANGHAGVVAVLAPLADDDERGLASAFLKAYGKSHGPEFEPPELGGLKRAAATAGARVSKFVGHDSPSERLARVDRAESHAGRKKP